MSVSSSANLKWTDRLVLPALIVAVLGYLYFKVNRIFACPSCFLFGDAGDGLKNYFTPAWWVAYDDGLWFTGMNYPYGEHPVYTDNQPIWSLLMKLIDHVVPMHDHVIGTINMFLLLSIVVGAVAMYLLLREYHLPRWYAALVTIPIILLSPQLDRFNAHYSLSYIFYIPLFLLCFVRWHKRGTDWRRGVLLLLLIAWMGFTHLYFLFIALAFLMTYALVLFVRNRFKWNRRITWTIALAVVAGIAVYAPVKISDPIEDRPEEVYGIYVYTATTSGTLLPWYEPWKKIWTEDFHKSYPDIEARSYVGIAGTLFAPFLLILAVIGLFKRKRNQGESEETATPGMVAWAGLLVWLVATGWFYEAGGSILLESFPVLGQFRSLGRLAWIFYYCYTAYVAWFAFTWISSIRVKWVKTTGIILGIIILLAWLIDANAYFTYTTQGIFRPNSAFKGDQPYLKVLHDNGLAPEDFQAIIQIPLAFAGTDNLSVGRGHWEFNKTFQCAWETGLPIINYQMSRTSVSSALSLLQLISSPDIPKVRLKDMNNKPLLLTTYKAQHLPTEERLVSLADSLGSVGTMLLYKLDISAFSGPVTPDTSSREVLHEGFEEYPSDAVFEGIGARRVEESEVFLEYTSPSSDTMQFSCWVHISPETPGFPTIRILQFDGESQQVEEEVYSIHSFDPWQVRGEWVEVTFPLIPKVNAPTFSFSILNKWALVDAASISLKRIK